MIVHIASDEKFINSAYNQFTGLENVENIFYIIVSDVTQPLKYVTVNDGVNIISKDIFKLRLLSKDISSAALVCFHGLDYFSSLILNSLPDETKVLWILFGTEVYSNPYLYKTKSLYGKLTYEEFIKGSIKDICVGNIKNIFRSAYYSLKIKTSVPYKEITNAMRRANFCGVLYKEEFDWIKRVLGTNIEYLKFSYYPIEQMLINTETKVSGNNILLGNSASATNNHLEAFELLKQINLEERKVIAPLSYGDFTYAACIINNIPSEIESNFVPLIEFMPLHEYNDYIQDCGVVLMNHYRQQAVGNVLTMIWMGSKVYLDKRNTLYSYLKRIGVQVYEITEDFISENVNTFEGLTDEQIENNRKCLINEIGQSTLFRDLDESIKQILCH